MWENSIEDMKQEFIESKENQAAAEQTFDFPDSILTEAEARSAKDAKWIASGSDYNKLIRIYRSKELT